MYRSAGQSMPHISTPADITTVNYTLEWPYLQNPSNTTFAGLTHFDICTCPHGNSSREQSSNTEPGHIYTRYKCVGPKVRFNPPEEKLWVLQAPHGPINMLRPATSEEIVRRKEIYDGAEPAVYTDRNVLFLTGPCPRGRYQAHATLQFLKALNPPARQQLSCLSLLVQPYEEDCADDSYKQAYAELAEYIFQKLPGFKRLCLNIWDDEMRLRNVASEFSILLYKSDVKIMVGQSSQRGETREYSNVRAFLEAMNTEPAAPGRRRFERGGLEEGMVWQGAEEEEEDDVDDDEEEVQDEDVEDSDEMDEDDDDSGGEEPSVIEEQDMEPARSYHDEQSVTGKAYASSNPRSQSSLRRTSIFHGKESSNTIWKEVPVEDDTIGMTSLSIRSTDTQDEDMKANMSSRETSGDGEGEKGASETDSTEALKSLIGGNHSSDDDWTDAALSPISPQNAEEESWQVL